MKPDGARLVPTLDKVVLDVIGGGCSVDAGHHREVFIAFRVEERLCMLPSVPPKHPRGHMAQGDPLVLCFFYFIDCASLEYHVRLLAGCYRHVDEEDEKQQSGKEDEIPDEL